MTILSLRCDWTLTVIVLKANVSLLRLSFAAFIYLFILFICRVFDNDGEFPLIEAAHQLPPWVNPETAEQRVSAQTTITYHTRLVALLKIYSINTPQLNKLAVDLSS